MSEQHPTRFYEFGPFRLDVAEGQLWRDGEAIQLTRKSFKVLTLLVANGSHVVDKNELMEKVWPDTFVEENRLADNISTLRKLLGDDPRSPSYIRTVPGRGYRFVADVRQVDDDAVVLVERTRTHVVIQEDRESRLAAADTDARASREESVDRALPPSNGHFGEISLNECDFNNLKFINFRGMQADVISFKDNKGISKPSLIVDRMSFKLIRPVNVQQLQFLFGRYDPEFYTNLEASFRASGYPDEADNVFVAKKRAERREKCPNIWRLCESRGGYFWNLFQDVLAGYGKRLQYLLFWSLGFLIIGTIVFRSERGMRTKDWDDTRYYAGKYRAFWYSLDLFLPIIKLGEADIWTPRDNRRWAILYKKIHIIIGSLFVPIGLAAWTGIIK